jgi:hypothetical protein
MTARNLYGTGIGGASNSVPQNPLEFLRKYAGKKVYVKMNGEFSEDLIGRFGKVLQTRIFKGYIAGNYKVEIDHFGDLILRYTYYVIQVFKVNWVEIDGKMVESEDNE